MRFLLAGILIFAPLCGFAEGEGAFDPGRPEEQDSAVVPDAEPPVDEECDVETGGPVGPPPDRTPDLFRAVAGDEMATVGQLLDSGVDVNAILPLPAPDDLLVRFRDTYLEYFFTKENGLTPLMLSSAMGYPDVVKLLLERGAKRNALTKKHRTFALWLAGRSGHVEVMQLLLGVAPESDAARTKIHISLAEQTAWLWRNGKIERTMPVSTGRKKFPTPKGRFVVTDKYKDWKSTIYPARMPYFLRLSCKDFGMHAGALPGYPASHGCIRLPAADAKALFAEVPVGTLVEID
ncbi:MAG: L,D-transpeptidase family protein [Terrimicrobiaceae bacterium]